MSLAWPPDIRQIRLPLVGNPLHHVNSYLIKADNGHVLVDCGWDTPDVLQALEEALREAGVGLSDVRTLVATHYHQDHYGLAGTLLRLGKMRLLMHRLDWVYLDTHFADLAAYREDSLSWLERNGFARRPISDEDRWAWESLQRFTLVAPDETVEDGQVIAVGRHTLRVVWTPGHTPGHICLFDADRRLLIAGDHVLDPITPNVSFWRDDHGNPLGDFLGSLRKVAALEADLVLPAHGEPFTGLQRRVRELLAHHDEREQAMLQAIDGHDATATEIARRVPWTRRRQRFEDLPLPQQRMAVSETLSHLRELEAQGHVARSAGVERILFYRAGRMPGSPVAPRSATSSRNVPGEGSGPTERERA